MNPFAKLPRLYACYEVVASACTCNNAIHYKTIYFGDIIGKDGMIKGYRYDADGQLLPAKMYHIDDIKSCVASGYFIELWDTTKSRFNATYTTVADNTVYPLAENSTHSDLCSYTGENAQGISPYEWGKKAKVGDTWSDGFITITAVA